MKIHKSIQQCDAQTQPRMLLGLALLAISLFTLPLILLAQAPVPADKPAAYPAWWFEQEVLSRTDTNQTNPLWPADYAEQKDFSAVNQGQVKWMARGAYLHLEEVILDAAVDPAVSGAITNSSEWSSLTNLFQVWQTTGGSASDYAAANQGQLKEVARHFYDVFALPDVLFYDAAISGWTSGETYPWSTVTGTNSDFAAVNTGQLKNLFAFDLSAWTPPGSSDVEDDQDNNGQGDGMPDWWEESIVYDDPDDGIESVEDVLPTDDYDGDGISNLAEYQAGTDATNFYDRPNEFITPLITIISGDGQSTDPDEFAGLPLIVEVSNSADGTVLANAPVTFAVLDGSGGVSLSSIPESDLLQSIEVRTDTTGTASVFYKAPATPAPSSVTVNATAIPSVSFNVYIVATQPPSAPVDLEVLEQENQDVLISWKDMAVNEEGFDVEVSHDNGVTWNVLDTALPNANSHLVDAASAGTPGNSQFQVVAKNPAGRTVNTGGPKVAEPDLSQDWDDDGLPNIVENEIGTDPRLKDTDGDGVNDAEDGWALNDGIQVPRLPNVKYAVIDLGVVEDELFGTLPDTEVYGTTSYVRITNNGLALKPGMFMTNGFEHEEGSIAGNVWKEGTNYSLPSKYAEAYSLSKNGDVVVREHTYQIYGPRRLFKYNTITKQEEIIYTFSGVSESGSIYNAGIHRGGDGLLMTEDGGIYDHVYRRHTTGEGTADLESNAYKTLTYWNGSAWSQQGILVRKIVELYTLLDAEPKQQTISYTPSPPAYRMSSLWEENGSGYMVGDCLTHESRISDHSTLIYNQSGAGYTGIFKGGAITRLVDIEPQFDSGFDGSGSMQAAITAGEDPFVVFAHSSWSLRNKAPIAIYKKGSGAQGYSRMYRTDLEENKIYNKIGARRIASNRNLEIIGRFINEEESIEERFIRNGRLVDLDELVPGWSNVVPSDMNEAGVILAAASNDSDSAYHSLLLVPIELQSMDRFVAGSIDQGIIDMWGGDEEVGIEIRVAGGAGEVYRFETISDAYVYEDPYSDNPEGTDDFFNDEMLNLGNSDPQNEAISQNVVFYRQDGRLHFRTVMDTNNAEIEVRILKDGDSLAQVEYQLVEHPEIGELIDTIDEILSDEWEYEYLEPNSGGGSGDPVVTQKGLRPQADPQPALATLSVGLGRHSLLGLHQSYVGGVFQLSSSEALFCANRVASEIASSLPTRRVNYRKRNATTKVCISIWDHVGNWFTDGVTQIKQAVTLVALTGKGFAEGAWFGIKDDAEGLVALVEMIANPVETGKMLYEGIKLLIGLTSEQWLKLGQTMIDSFVSVGVQGAQDWGFQGEFEVKVYLFGFTGGYLTEQVMIGYAIGLAGKAAVAKKMIEKLKVAVSNSVPTLKAGMDAAKKNIQIMKNQLFRQFSKDVKSQDDVKALKKMCDELADACAI